LRARAFACIKAARKHVDEIDSRCQFHQRSTYSFYTRKTQKRKKILLSHQYLFALLGSAGAKAARKHVDEIDSRSLSTWVAVGDTSATTQLPSPQVRKLAFCLEILLNIFPRNLFDIC